MKDEKILYYRKLKPNPKVWIPAIQMNATLDISSELDISSAEPVFVGITHYSSDYCIYFGYIEHAYCPAEVFDRVEIELNEDDFIDDKKYTKKEVDQILHPILYYEPIFK